MWFFLTWNTHTRHAHTHVTADVAGGMQQYKAEIQKLAKRHAREAASRRARASDNEPQVRGGRGGRMAAEGCSSCLSRSDRTRRERLG